MERHWYTMDLMEDEANSYAIISCINYYTRSKQRQYLPITMEVVHCTCGDNEINLAELIRVPDGDDRWSNADFVKNRIDILQGKRPEWILYGFEPLTTGIQLWYYNETLDVEEKINLHVGYRVKQNAHLCLRFEVPHANEKPNTQYLFQAECLRDNIYKEPRDFVALVSTNQDTYKCMSFEKYRDQNYDVDQADLIYPDYADVTEYTDI